MKADTTIEQTYRRFLLLTAALVFVVTPVELLLEEHYKGLLQLIPFLLCGAGLAAVAAMLWLPRQRVIMGLRAVMILIALGGLFGFYEHVTHNIGFEREIRPEAGFAEAAWEGLFGASPLMAPGILAFGALLAFAATYRHPSVRGCGRQPRDGTA